MLCPMDATKTQSVDSSPKWFTEIELDASIHWTGSAIEYVPRLQYDDSAFTRVVMTPLSPPLTPYAKPGA